MHLPRMISRAEGEPRTQRRLSGRIVCAAIAVVCALVLVASFGEPLPQVPFASIELADTTAASSDGSTTAVVVEQSRKVLLLNEAGRYEAVIDCGAFEMPVETVTDVCVSGGYVFVAGARRTSDGSLIERERVVCYSLDGKQRGVVMDIENSDVIPRIVALDDADEGVYVLMTDEDEETSTYLLRVLQVTAEGEQTEVKTRDVSELTVVSASYAPEPNRLVVLSNDGGLYGVSKGESYSSSDHIFTSVAVAEDGSTYACDDLSQSLCRVDDQGEMSVIEGGELSNRVRCAGDVVTILNHNVGVVCLLDVEGHAVATLQSVAPSARVTFRIVLVWVCAAYLVGLLVVLSVRAAWRALRERRTDGLTAALATVAVVAVMGIVIVNSATYSYNEQVGTRINEVNAYGDFVDAMSLRLADQLAPLDSRTAMHEVFDAREDGDEAANSCVQALFLIDDMVSSAVENNLGIYVMIYGRDDRGVYCVSDTLCEFVEGEGVSGVSNTEEVFAAFDELDTLERGVLRGTSRYEDTLYRLVRLASRDGTSDGLVIEVGSHMNSLSYTILSGQFRNMLSLLVLALVVYLAYEELRACVHCVVRYRHMQEIHEEGAISALARPFLLVTNTLAGIDGVMSTLIAKDMLAAEGLSGVMILVALPAIMVALGQTVGQAVYGRLGTKVGPRRLMIRWSLALLACALGTAGVVWSGSFVGYCAAKFVLSLPFGLLSTAANSFRGQVVTSEQRGLAKAGVKHSNVSSAVLGTALGGYASQFFGNAWVYVVVALVSLALLAMSQRLIPEHTPPLEEAHEVSAEERSSMLGFLRSPAALLIVLCLILPSVIASGYTSFFFPLFSSDLGLAKADISNMYLLSQLVLYVSTSGILAFTYRVGKRNAALYAIAALGVVFCAFAFDNTVVWGVVVIVLVTLLVKTSGAYSSLWNAAATSAGVPFGWASNALFIVRSAMRIAKPFMLGALVVFGQAVVPIIGVMCLVCALVYGLATRSKA